MGVTALVVQIVLPIGDTDVFAIILTGATFVNNGGDRGMIKPRIENDGFRAFADPIAELTVIGLAFLVMLECAGLVS